MSVIFNMDHCFGCGNLFTYNPAAAPSFKDKGGGLHVFCQDCIDRINTGRIINSLPPLAVRPDAYEPFNESDPDLVMKALRNALFTREV